MKRHPADELVAMLEAEGLPCAKVATIAEVAASEQLRHRGHIAEMEFGGQTVPMQGVTIHLSDTPLTIRSPIPQVGAHNADVLQGWLGWEPGRIDRLASEQPKETS
jgi:crotonobetainyl-CoA:carnitine CoA-transferase CaiB-like acyl-CoA transferase